MVFVLVDPLSMNVLGHAAFIQKAHIWSFILHFVWDPGLIFGVGLLSFGVYLRARLWGLESCQCTQQMPAQNLWLPYILHFSCSELKLFWSFNPSGNVTGGISLQILSPFHCILDFSIVDFIFWGNDIFLTPFPNERTSKLNT